ncbi:hypothetical protein [Poriferisphaera sp. WC338]|uniref:hypothetical protein n=1 Tax=Poriferisphaera sp. WC338 TaxID=3425129 RepID=UPI003D817B6E
MLRMNVIIDDVPVALSGSTLSEVVESAREHLADDGRIVVEVEWDAQVLQGDDLAATMSKSVDGHSVRLITANPANLAVLVLGQVRGQLAEIKQWQEQAAENLQQDQPAPALERIGECISGWLAIQEAVGKISGLVNMNLDDVKTGNGTAIEHIAGLAEQLKTLKQLLEDRDVITLADVMAYEWPGVADDWDGLAKAMVDRIEGV